MKTVKINKNSYLRAMQSIALEDVNKNYYHINKYDNTIIFKFAEIVDLFNKEYNYLLKTSVLYSVEKGLNHNEYDLSYFTNNKIIECNKAFYKGIEIRIDNIDIINIIEKNYNIEFEKYYHYDSIIIYDNLLLADILNLIREYDLNNNISIRRLSIDECLYDSFGRLRNRNVFINIDDVNIIEYNNFEYLDDLEIV
jgi:hypothetical protein